MVQALFSALSGMQASLFRTNTTANNIANVNTPGFKSARADQVDVGSGGTRIGSVTVNFGQGPLEIASPGFDLAVNGNGFFQVAAANGTRYSRAGAFHLDANRFVVDGGGNRLVPNIQLPLEATAMNVGKDGTVSAILPGGDVQTVGQIQLARFANPGGLLAQGGSLSATGPNSGPAIVGNPAQGEFGDIVFGALEGSNVDLAQQLTNLITDKATFAANTKVLKATDEMLGDLLDTRG